MNTLSPMFLQAAGNTGSYVPYIQMKSVVGNPIITEMNSGGHAVTIVSTKFGERIQTIYPDGIDGPVYVDADPNTLITIRGEVSYIYAPDTTTYINFSKHSVDGQRINDTIRMLNFEGCAYLKEIDLSNLKTLTNLNVGNCDGLVEINLSSVGTEYDPLNANILQCRLLQNITITPQTGHIHDLNLGSLPMVRAVDITGAFIGTLYIGLNYLESINAVTQSLDAIQISDSCRNVNRIEVLCDKETVIVDGVIPFLSGVDHRGIIYTNPLGAYYQQLVDVATEHGWIVAPLAESENHQQSQIRDDDMAEEMMPYRPHNILEQGNQSMLA